MTLILGMTELVRNRTQDERLKPILNNVMDAATGLTRMLNDLIDLAALETRQVTFQFAPCRCRSWQPMPCSCWSRRRAKRGCKCS